MNGTIKERIVKKGIDRNGKTKENLKVYDVYYRFPDSVTGKLKQTSKKGFRSKGEAEAFLLKINTQFSDGTFVQKKKLTVREYFSEWLDTYVKPNLRDLTISGYTVNIKKHIIPNLGHIELQSLTSRHLDEFYVKLKREGRLDGKGGLSTKTILYIHRVIHEALQHAIKKKLISKNAATEINDLPKSQKFKSQIYDKSEIKKLIQSSIDTVFEIPVILSSLCGMRRGEILGLKWADVNLTNHELTVSAQLLPTRSGLKLLPPKSEDSFRKIILSPQIVKIFEKQLKKQEDFKKVLGIDYENSDFVVTHPDGKPIDPRHFSKMFARHLAKCNFKHIRFHDLRHSAASLMLSSGVQMKVTSQILGHSSIGITADLYTHVVDDLKKDAAMKISNSIFDSNDF